METESNIAKYALTKDALTTPSGEVAVIDTGEKCESAVMKDAPAELSEEVSVGGTEERTTTPSKYANMTDAPIVSFKEESALDMEQGSVIQHAAMTDAKNTPSGKASARVTERRRLTKSAVTEDATSGV